jgi:hypothetical protein
MITSSILRVSVGVYAMGNGCYIISACDVEGGKLVKTIRAA